MPGKRSDGDEDGINPQEGGGDRLAQGPPSKFAETRRGLAGLLMRSSAVAALFASTMAPRNVTAAGAPETSGVQVWPTVASLRTADSRQRAALVEGFASPGDGGGGLFVWVDDVAARIDGAVRVASARPSGHWQRQDYNAGRVRPQWFGALGASSDHSTVLQAAIDFIEAEGGGGVDLGNGHYRCFSRVVLDPTRCSLFGHGAVLDFSRRRSADRAPGASTNLIGSGEQAAWNARPAGAGRWQFRDGRLAYTWAEGDQSALVRPMPMQNAGRYRLSASVTELNDERIDPGITFILNRAGTMPTRVIVRGTGRVGEFATEFSWPFDSPGELEVRATASCQLDRIAVDFVGETECLLVRTKPSSSRYSHSSQSISGIRIVGPDRDQARPTPSEGIVFQTLVPDQSSRLTVANVEITGCTVGCKFLDRAYLIQFHDVRFNARTGVEFIAGAPDAGENFSFFGCTFDEGNVPIRNAGADIYAYGCSFDFTRQFYVGSGLFYSFGCHYETRRPKERTQYPFEVHSGQVYLSGGVLMISGIEFELGNKCDYIFWLESRYSRVFIDNVSCWNLRSATGALAGGKGRLYAERIMGGGNKQVAHVTKRDDIHNLLGPAGRLAGDRILLDISLSGGELSDRMTSTNGRISLDPSASPSGSKALVITKDGIPGAPLRAILLAPFAPGNQFGWDANVLYRHDAGEKARFLISTSFVQINGRDRLGAPIFSGIQFAGEIHQELSSGLLAQDWARVGLGSDYSDNTSPTDGYAPEWTTHVAIMIDMTQVPPRGQLLLSDIFVCRF